MGVGSAGSIIASRLSEDPAVTVAALEAGEDDDKYPDSKVPLAIYHLQNTELDWAYRTVPQEKACKSLEGNVSLIHKVFISQSNQAKQIHVSSFLLNTPVEKLIGQFKYFREVHGLGVSC